MKNKATALSDLIIEQKLDIIAVTESWLCGDTRDDHVLGDLKNTLPQYNIYHKPRKSKTGGGICLLSRNIYVVKRHTTPSYRSFEHMEFTISTKTASIELLATYRPPPSQKNKLTPNLFFEEFSSLLERVTIIPRQVILAGDFNIHVDVDLDPLAVNFRNVLISAGLQQHVKGRTHKNGHTLDLLITRKIDDVISDVNILYDTDSDHSAISCQIGISQPAAIRVTKTTRNLRDLAIPDFINDIGKSALANHLDRDLDTLALQTR
ncbi:hypothetical protein BSL78_09523 [Apostichopus japonicus]|uniref:Endonuclease/exonuclease/phosphatase domain-containing protein n=1 Tax=Stichopus japonicus TaxID=307972 RepID=A0A2G8L070_STIJA|nr:hypothetical protein BSL78_09523 [Apostichopus japonicus]